MANWCNNIVQWEASEDKMEQLETLFLHMAERQKETDKGQLPEGFEDGEGFMFYPSWEGGTTYYETRWSPNTDIIKKIADLYGADFIHNYEELGNCIYGEAQYIDGVLTDTFLEASDFAQYDYNDESDHYLFEGQTHDSDWEILEILLERKKNKDNTEDTKNIRL